MKATVRTREALRAAAGRQQGIALVIALTFLLLMTMIGVTSMQTATLQERMAGNMRDRNVSFQSAESALREGEDFLTQVVLPPFDGADGLYQPAVLTDAPRWEQVDWENAAAVREYLVPDGVAAAYIIEEFPPMPDPAGTLAADEPLPEVSMYRLTARSTGASGTAEVRVQSTFRRQ